jgi:hypothetical protein
MQKNASITKARETDSRKNKISSNKKHSSKKMPQSQTKPRSERSRLMALQDALQDPIVNCEGF